MLGAGIKCGASGSEKESNMAVNKVILVGRLGQNPELKHTPGGQAVANFSVATNESWTDKSGAKQERVEWHRVVVWGKTAELCAQYLAKGRQCYLEGKLQTREWMNKENQKQYTTEVVAQTVQFLGSAAEGGARPPTPGDANAPRAAAPQTAAPSEPSFTSDDIPF
jgi:single-strand DNA-binding protein